MKKILHISKYYYPFSGGTEQIARDVVLALKGEYEQKIIAFNDGKEDNSYSNLVLRKLRINNAGIRTAKNGNGIGIWQPYHQLCTQ